MRNYRPDGTRLLTVVHETKRVVRNDDEKIGKLLTPILLLRRLKNESLLSPLEQHVILLLYSHPLEHSKKRHIYLVVFPGPHLASWRGQVGRHMLSRASNKIRGRIL